MCVWTVDDDDDDEDQKKSSVDHQIPSGEVLSQHPERTLPKHTKKQQDEDVLRETKREQKKCSDTSTVHHSGSLELQKSAKIKGITYLILT